MINIQWIVPILRTQRPSETKVCYTSSYCIVLPKVIIISFWDVKKILKRLRNTSKSRYLFYINIVTVTIRFVWKRIFHTIELYKKLFFARLLSNFLIMRTILWVIKFSVIVHLCVENSFSWWNSLLFSIWSIKLIDT